MKHFTMNLELERRAPNHSARMERVPCRVDLLIDEERLMRALGTKALSNKSKRSREVDGLIVVKVHTL